MKVSTGIVTAVAIAAMAVVGMAGAAPPKPLPPQAAQQAVIATAHADPVVVRQVPVEVALAAGNAPGASEERYHARRNARALQSAVCWFAAPRVNWGTWPYDQHVTQNTYWCATYGWAITYRSTSITYSSTLCSGHNQYSFRVNGGTGYFGVDVEGGTYFDCPTDIPWITIHRNDWAQWEYNSVGSAYFVTSS